MFWLVPVGLRLLTKKRYVPEIGALACAIASNRSVAAEAVAAMRHSTRGVARFGCTGAGVAEWGEQAKIMVDRIAILSF